MDYTPIGLGRVLIAFAFTAMVAVLPVVAVVLNGHSAVLSSPEGYGGVVLGLGSAAFVAALIGFVRLAFATRRGVGRPSRA